jgi:hypothetical protein
MQAEVQLVRQKREEIDNMLQDAKTTICQQMIQMRQMQSASDTQALEIAGLSSQVRREQVFAEQAQAECQRMRALIEESDQFKV